MCPCLGSVSTCFLLLCVPAGKVVKHLSLSLFGSSFLGSEEHAGFLYIRSTLQSLQGLPLPNQPYLFGLLVTQSRGDLGQSLSPASHAATRGRIQM